jgi:hypothetical protein
MNCLGELGLVDGGGEVMLKGFDAVKTGVCLEL